MHCILVRKHGVYLNNQYLISRTRLVNIRPHQLCWGDREMGSAVSYNKTVTDDDDVGVFVACGRCMWGRHVCKLILHLD